jgi:hypothetical protein
VDPLLLIGGIAAYLAIGALVGGAWGRIVGFNCPDGAMLAAVVTVAWPLVLLTVSVLGPVLLLAHLGSDVVVPLLRRRAGRVVDAVCRWYRI